MCSLIVCERENKRTRIELHFLVEWSDADTNSLIGCMSEVILSENHWYQFTISSVPADICTQCFHNLAITEHVHKHVKSHDIDKGTLVERNTREKGIYTFKWAQPICTYWAMPWSSATLSVSTRRSCLWKSDIGAQRMKLVFIVWRFADIINQDGLSATFTLVICQRVNRTRPRIDLVLVVRGGPSDNHSWAGCNCQI